MEPEGLLRRLQLVRRQESFHQGEAGLADLIESGVREPHDHEL